MLSTTLISVLRQTPGFKDPQHPNKVWKLNKALYGLKQSPRLWYMELHEHLLSLGFQRSGYEACLYARRDSSGGELMVAVYVDDLVISGSSSAMVSDFKRSLASKYDLTDLGELTQILGIKVTRDKLRKCFYLSQTSFIKDAVSKFGLDYTCLPAEPPWTIPQILPLPLALKLISLMLTGTGLS